MYALVQEEYRDCVCVRVQYNFIVIVYGDIVYVQQWEVYVESVRVSLMGQ